MTYVYAIGRAVYDQDNRLIAAFSDAWLAIEFAASVNAGDIEIERRSA